MDISFKVLYDEKKTRLIALKSFGKMFWKHPWWLLMLVAGFFSSAFVKTHEYGFICRVATAAICCLPFLLIYLIGRWLFSKRICAVEKSFFEGAREVTCRITDRFYSISWGDSSTQVEWNQAGTHYSLDENGLAIFKGRMLSWWLVNLEDYNISTSAIQEVLKKAGLANIRKRFQIWYWWLEVLAALGAGVVVGVGLS